MKKIVIVVFIIFLILNCSENDISRKYFPRYKQYWSEVETTILDTWMESKVDAETWQMPGSLELPYDYFSIHTGRNVLFGWDTYFTNAGIVLVDSFAVYAKNAVENQFAEIEQIGYVPNASEPWALNRSQTTFLSMMVREVYETPGLADKKWLRQAYDILKKEYHFWTDMSEDAIEDHSTSIPGLQRFYHHATDEELLKFYVQLAPRFGFPIDLSKEEKLTMGEAWLSEAESGMDFTPRFENRCHEFVAIDLNSNLYMYEINFAWMVEELGLREQPDWEGMAEKRRSLLTKYCWNAARGVFMDYDYVNERFSKVASVAAFYPLWAGLATEAQAEVTVDNLSLFEYDYGPTICEKTEQERAYQWDYPAGWPPIYYLVVTGLDNYCYKNEAARIAGKYLDIVARNFMEPIPETFSSRKKGVEKLERRVPGYVYEKYNVVNGTIYDAEYPSRPFHGWSYGVYMWCLDYYNTNAIK